MCVKRKEVMKPKQEYLPAILIHKWLGNRGQPWGFLLKHHTWCMYVYIYSVCIYIYHIYIYHIDISIPYTIYIPCKAPCKPLPLGGVAGYLESGRWLQGLHPGFPDVENPKHPKTKTRIWGRGWSNLGLMMFDDVWCLFSLSLENLDSGFFFNINSICCWCFTIIDTKTPRMFEPIGVASKRGVPRHPTTIQFPVWGKIRRSHPTIASRIPVSMDEAGHQWS